MKWLPWTTPKDTALDGEIEPTYTQADRDNAPPGHLPYPGTDVEVVSYREGHDLVLLVNKGPCIFRTRLVGAFRNDLDTMLCNTLMRDERIVLGELPADVEELVKKLAR